MATEPKKDAASSTQEDFEIVDAPVKYEAEPDKDGKIVQQAADDDDGEADEAEGQEDQRLDADAGQENAQSRDRRTQRQKAKERRLAAQERDKALIANLAEQNRLISEKLAQIEASTTNTQVQQITSRMDQLSLAYKQLETKKAEAIRLGDGDAVLRIEKEMNGYSSEWHTLDGRKKQMTPSLETQARQAAERTPPQQLQNAARVEELANRFLQQHAWINPQANDADNQRVREIDQELMKEGLIPSTRAFWSEFSERLKDEFPQKFRTAGQRTSPPIGSGREHVPNSTRTQVFVSPERRKAMEEAGTWDDPVERKKQLAYYAKYDRENGAAR